MEKPQKNQENQKEDTKNQADEDKKQLDVANAKLSEYKDLLQRVQADFENYKKRCNKEMSEGRQYANIEIISSLLPIIDSFEFALKNTENEQFAQGVKMIFAQIYSALEAQGLKRIDAVGKRFDPYFHEVLLIDESGDEGIVLEELQKGYLLKNAVIRHSKVKVGKKNQQGETQ